MPTEKRLMTIEDVMNIRYIEDPQISPDGQWIAYVIRTSDEMERSYKRDIYMVSTDGGEPIRLTRSGKNTSPRWSPDSANLAFVSSRDEKGQIYILPIKQPGEALQLTSNENGASAPAWSPDGENIAYLSRMNADEREKEDSDDNIEPPQDKLEGTHRKERKAEDEKNRFDPRAIERIPFREGTTFNDDRFAQIYVIPTAENGGIKARRLTNTDVSYSAPVWSKSGRHIVTTRSWNLGSDEPLRSKNIYLIEFESGIERRIKDEDNRYFDAIPSYDGDWLACMRAPAYGADNIARLTVMHLEGADAVDLNLEADLTVVSYDWTSDNNLLVTVQNQGRYELYTLEPQSKTYTLILGEDQSLYNVNLGENGGIAYVSRTASRLDELFYIAPDGQAQQMTHVNTDFMEEIEVLPTHEIRFKNPSGREIHGWYILPPNYEEGKKYPLALNIHGGPRSMWTPSSRSMWHEWQTHAAEGYVVFYCNPRGTDGYGEEHIKSLNSAWGTAAMEDIMAGVDLMIEKGIVDSERMVLSGGSYGGYMTAWIIGQTDRFKAAVSQRGVYNLNSMYGTTDIPSFMSAWWQSEPWEDHTKHWDNSPLKYAPNIKTPTLIIHSENDFRVPIEQAEQLFAWIRRATDTPVKLLRYPREGHELSRSGEPQHRISRLTEMMNWFKQYCPTD